MKKMLIIIFGLGLFFSACGSDDEDCDKYHYTIDGKQYTTECCYDSDNNVECWDY